MYSLLENFSASFAAIYVLGGLRALFSIAMALGGPQAYWATYVISSVFVLITAAVLAEACSSLPAAGSLYYWAAESGGPRFGRLFGFVAAWYSTTAWVSYLASNSQAAANYLLSEIAVFGLDYSTDVTDIKFRTVQWIVGEVFLAISVIVNYFPRHWYKYVFKGAVSLMLVDFVLNMVWLPIAVSKTYGFQTASWVFTKYENLSGAPSVWNWMLGFYSPGGVLVGFDASGHVSEETKNSAVVSARGLWYSAVASVIMGFPVVIMFLFCTPNLDSLFAYASPQPFVQYYAASLGMGGHVVMNVVVILAVISSTSVSVLAASRLVFAIARDGVLPFSSWIAKVDKHNQPANAITVVAVVAAILLCGNLPSSVAFYSLVSCAAVPTLAVYGLVGFGRFFITPRRHAHPQFSLGRLSRPFQLITFLWNIYLAAILFSPLQFPVTAQNFNYAPVVMTIITIFALSTWAYFPKESWLRWAQLQKANKVAQDGTS